MLHVQDRHVRKLRITAAAEDRLWKGRILLEDALRTASLPGLTAGRLTIVRHFSIGRFSDRRSSTFLATLIAQKLGALMSHAVPADHPNAASYPVVYFNDEFEPYCKLALRIAGGEDTSSWFWPLAVREWRPALSSREGLRAILYRLASTPAGPAGAVALVSEMRRRNVLDTLLANLEQDDGVRLLRVCGWTNFSADPESTNSPERFINNEIRPVHEQVLRRWLKRWDSTDPRLIWLAATLLVEEKPARLLDRRHLRRAQSLIERLARSNVPPATSAVGPVNTSVGPVEWAVPHQSQSWSKPPTTSESSRLEPAPESACVISDPAVASAMDEQEHSELTLASDDAPVRLFVPVSDANRLMTTGRSGFIRTTSSKFEINAGETSAGELSTQATTPQFQNANRSGVEIVCDADDYGEGSSNKSGQGDASPVVALRSQSGLAHDSIPNETVHESALEVVDQWLTNDSQLFTNNSQLTEFGGFYFLLPLMSRLGLTGFLEQHPNLIEFDFPERLLHFAAKRLRIPDDDPILTPIRKPIDLAQQPIGSSENDVDEAVRSWYGAMMRWSHRFARLRLARMVRRRGRIAVTRTHVDLFFDLRSVNIHIRRAGLDLDPGWVPWFGRVVSFHYLEREQTDDRY